MAKYTVQIIEKATKEVVEEIPANNVDQALRVERGVKINLNHKDYRTKLKVEEDNEKTGV